MGLSSYMNNAVPSRNGSGSQDQTIYLPAPTIMVQSCRKKISNYFQSYCQVTKFVSTCRFLNKFGNTKVP